MIHDVYIDGVALTRKHVKSVSTSEISLTFAGSKLISGVTTVVLSNHGYTYDDRPGTGGLFEADDWYNATVTIYNVETGDLVWEGRLKKIEVKDSDMTVTLTVNDYIKDMVDTVCVISMTGTTVSEAIYAILTDESRLAIPESKLIQSGFEIAKGKQQTELIDIELTAQNNKNCISVLEELCKDSNSHIFQKDYMIGYWVWEDYTGTVATSVKKILPGSYSHHTDDTQIKNSYNIAYNNTGTVDYATGSDATSEADYGAGKQFAMPEDAPDSTAPGDFRILYNTQAGAAAVGAQILARYKDKKRICEFTTGWEYNYISLGDVLDLRFGVYTREPVRVVSFKPDRAKRIIQFECEAVNYPEVIALDLDAPDPVLTLSALVFEDYVLLKWSRCTDASLQLYKLYYSASENYWGDEYLNGQYSPLSLPENNVTILEGDCFYEFGPVTEGRTWYFRVTAVDASFNESVVSNTIKIAFTQGTLENRYCLAGNPVEGLILDLTNAGGGSGLDEWIAEYDDAEYDTAEYTPTALYVSPVLYKPGGFSYLLYMATGNLNDVQLQYRTYNGTSFSSWSAVIDAVGAGSVVFSNNEYIQYRVIFNSRNWSDTDKFMIREVA